MITTAGKLPAKHVIHTVGPVWNGGRSGEPGKLESCYLNSLLLAEKYECRTIAFPNISTGIYGYPKAEAAKIATSTVQNFLKTSILIEKVIFVCFDEENFGLYADMV